MWKTILVPHDFSSCANHAAALARDVAKIHGARLILLHVAEIPPMLGPFASVVPDEGGAPINVRDYAMRSAEAHLDDLAGRLRADGIEVSTVATTGNTAGEIAACAERERAELIVMGTHGRTGLAHVVLGSVTERVVRHSVVPVLTVRVPDQG
ncbi:MAG: universal stress protein [Kofleriaceae bacterium]|nr:universal stress protein [Kofleriaceae bacterium]MCL4228656.1 universal stress protein [Myxococcales bacterium]